MALKAIPTTRDEMKKLGWDYADIILFSGDAYIDHPSFAMGILARVLENQGYRVAVVPQPNWRDDLRDFKKLGRPRLFFSVSAGAMDSMVNHYTAFKRLRSNDAYSPGGQPSLRPDYAVTVYTQILKRLYPDVPVVIGGIEASLRRFTHYDYWQDKLLPTVLYSSGADYLTYGMGEKSMVQMAKFVEGKIHSGANCSAALSCNVPLEEKLQLKQTGFLDTSSPSNTPDAVILHSFEKCVESKKAFIENFNQIEMQANLLHPKRVVERIAEEYLYVNPPFEPMTSKELDAVYDLPYTFLPHPRYKNKTIPAFEMIKNSITIHRGCFGGCSFCTIAAHQGKFIQSRSRESILKEIKELSKLPHFKGVISDIGAPSANMYMMGGKDKEMCGKCRRKSCLYPNVCKNLNISYKELLKLYRDIDKMKEVKHSYVGSGVRYDLFLDKDGFLNPECKEYFQELVTKHVSGWFKVAPEHTEDKVLSLMNKPSFKLFERLKTEFEKTTKKAGLKEKIVPYFISSHPGCTKYDMKALASNKALKGVNTEQVQSITPTPLTRSSVMYYTGMDPQTFKPIFVERRLSGQKEQKSYFFGGKSK